jgi:predicted nucleic acid-binding protein
VGILELIRGKRVYMDANVFVYAIEGNAIFPELARVFQAFGDGIFEIVTSELTLAEVLVKPIREQRHDVRQKFETILQTSQGMIVAPVSRLLLTEAAAIRAEQTNLKLPDAIHLSTALESRCHVFLTNDLRVKSEALEVIQLSESLKGSS